MPKWLLIFIAICLLVWTNESFAHQQKAAETTVLFNKRSGKLEIMHRFYIHDTEHAVQSLFDKNADIIDSDNTQQQFSRYVAKQFLMRSLDDQPISLNTVGFETDGKFFWVYQDTELLVDNRGVKLYHGALRELWPTQINMVNIEGKGAVRTLYFSDNKQWLVVEL